MFEWDSVLPMSMLFRTPLAPLLVGGSLDLVGGYGTQVAHGRAVRDVDRVLDPDWRSCSVAAQRFVTAVALPPLSGLRDPLPHAVERLDLRVRLRRLDAPPDPRVARADGAAASPLLGLATAAAALTRPGYQVLAVFALLPLALGDSVERLV